MDSIYQASKFGKYTSLAQLTIGVWVWIHNYGSVDTSFPQSNNMELIR